MKDYSVERVQRAEADTWALQDLYISDDAWRADLEELKRQLPQLPTFRGRLANAEDLLAYMKLNVELSRKMERLYGYAGRKSDQDTRIAANQAMVSEISSVAVSASEACAFETPELLAIPEETFEQFYAEVPALAEYRRYFDNVLRRKAHVLSDAEEKLLAAAGDMAQTAQKSYAIFANSDLRFPDAVDSEGKTHPLSAATYIGYLMSQDRTLRKSAFENLYHTWDTYKNTVATMLEGQVKRLAYFANARNYPDSLTASLSTNHVPTSVYENLIRTVHANIDKLHRYGSLRKKLMGLDELHMYDLYTSLVPSADADYTLDEAKQIVYEALAPLGERYRAILKEGFENRWMDPYPNPGKRSGAYSSGEDPHPFVLMNFDGTLDSVSTLAHEFGHAIHSYLSKQNQSYLNSRYVIFVAEVASTCNEALLMQHLLQKTTDRKMRAYLINHILEQFRGTLYRQTMFAEFELEIGKMHQAGQPLTADVLCETYRKLNAFYYGEDVISDPEIANEWQRIPHFYYNYYVFQYATGYAAAIALSRRILREGEPAVNDYLAFLSGGCSKDPIDLLRGAGVDMASEQPVEDALAFFGEMLDEMEALMQD